MPLKEQTKLTQHYRITITGNQIYPYLGENKAGTRVILFTGPARGVLIVDRELPENAGMYSDEWLEKNFIPFKGEVTLRFDTASRVLSGRK